MEYSRSYPGLKTVYNIHTVKCRVKDVDNPEMSFIGLPEGNDFAVTRVRGALASRLEVWNEARTSDPPRPGRAGRV